MATTETTSTSASTTTTTTVSKPKRSRAKVKVKRTRGVGKHKFTEFVPHSKGKPLEAGEKRIILNIVSKLEEERPYELQKEIYKIASKYTGVSLSTVQNIKKEDKHKVLGESSSGKSKSNNNTNKVKRTRRRKKKESEDPNFLNSKDLGLVGGVTNGGGGANNRQQHAQPSSGSCIGGGASGVVSDVRNDLSFGANTTLPIGLYHQNHHHHHHGGGGGTCTQGTFYLSSSLQTNIHQNPVN